MPLIPASLIEPVWVEFAALIGTEDRPEYDPSHPLGCHRHRVADRVVFDCVIAALVHGSGYERVAVPGCSDRTIRRRLEDWATKGVTQDLLKATLTAYDRVLGLDLEDLAVDGSITKSVGGGDVSGRSPVDRGKQGTKRSVVVDAAGIPPVRDRRRGKRPRLSPVGTHPGWRPGHGRAPAGRRVHAPGRRLRLAQNSTPAGVLGLYPAHRYQRQASAPAGHQTVAGRADPLLDERVRQAPPLHRQNPTDRGVLPLPSRRDHRHPPRDHHRPDPLPMAHPTDHQTPTVTNCRSV